ncbi:MAG: hypothetical protein ACRDFX_09930, partial [Chloroflexota bacterium]
MTVCIGALCKDEQDRVGWAIILSSDRMVTMGGFIEFEHEVPKGSPLAHKAIALIAGDALRGNQLVQSAKHQV